MSDVSPSWSQLHDATLVTLAFDWSSGVVTVSLRLNEAAMRTAEIVATGASLLRVPRRQPWGPSVSINEVRGPYSGARERLEIELQSGDTVEIEADRFTLKVTDSPT